MNKSELVAAVAEKAGLTKSYILERLRNSAKKGTTMTINEYRRNHRRCSTCTRAEKSMFGYTCKAKNQYIGTVLSCSGKNGKYCKLYEPVLVEE